jgi:type II secretory pathway component HofQ
MGKAQPSRSSHELKQKRAARRHAAAVQHAVCAALGMGGVHALEKPQTLHALAPNVGHLLSTHRPMKVSAHDVNQRLLVDSFVASHK